MLSALFYILMGVYLEQEYHLPSIKNISIYIFTKYKQHNEQLNDKHINKINESKTNDISNNWMIYNKLKEYMNI